MIPGIFFNEISPNNNHALANKTVRQALEYAIDRTHLVQDEGGPLVAPPLTHYLPPGIVGSKPADPYPYDPQKAKQLLASVIPGGHLTLKLLYMSDNDFEVKMFQTLQFDLSKVGVTVTGVPVPSTDFYTKYLYVPSVAKRGVWDMVFAEEGPDWFGNGALSLFGPIFGGTAEFPPGIDFWYYNDPVTTRLIHEATVAITSAEAGALWAKADEQVMADAAVFPVASPLSANYHSSLVHNAVYIPNLGQFDPANVWLSP